MKLILLLPLIGLLLANAAAADLKIAVIDLDQIIARYHKAEEGRKDLEAREASLIRDLRGLQAEGQKLAQEAERLRTLALDSALSAAAREEKKKSFASKVEEIQRQALKLEDFRNDGRQQLSERHTQLQYRLAEDVTKATTELGEKEGYHLILNANKSNPTASAVLFARHVDDVTEKILASLNSGQPGTNAPPVLKK